MVRKRKPKFLRQGWFRYRRLGMKWRKPRGRHSKMRLGKKSKPARPSPGYRKPKDVRGLVRGYRPALVSNIGELKKVGTGQAVMVSSTVGLRKTLAIAERAEKLGLKLLNPRRIERAKKIAAKKAQQRLERMKKEKKEVKEAKEEEVKEKVEETKAEAEQAKAKVEEKKGEEIKK